jgi:putative oxidoreductase
VSASFLALGAQAPDLALTLNRVALGVFFAISGYLKLFNVTRHATLTRTLEGSGVRAVRVMQWLVPGVEFSAGLALIVGFLSALAAFGVFVICLFAFKLDALKRIDSWMPINRFDRIGDVLYLPEVLYCIGLLVVMLGGPGPWSVDAALIGSAGSSGGVGETSLFLPGRTVPARIASAALSRDVRRLLPARDDLD